MTFLIVTNVNSCDIFQILWIQRNATKNQLKTFCVKIKEITLFGPILAKGPFLAKINDYGLKIRIITGFW